MRGPTGLKVSAKRSRQHGHGARHSSAACSPWHLSRPVHTPYRRLGVVWNFDRRWRSVPRVCGPWTVLPCCGNSALPISLPPRFVAPASGNQPDARNDFPQHEGSANRARKSRATHAICITMRRVNKIRHIARKKMHASHHDARSVTCMPRFGALRRAFIISKKMMKASAI